jgi:hypothetical protein
MRNNSLKLLAASGLILLFLSGCAGRPAVDWNSRIGVYTFDQAVLELGPPDRSSELSDGTRVAEWISYRPARGAVTFGMGTGFHRRHTAVGVGHTVGVPIRGADILRLTFAPDGRLIAWNRV